ncbi:MAG: hypothetical protein HN712_20220 [Gemmatimonadetes bacterium]|jgi:hypothetical protein|nr:hypothetical protein [Gemmatimonadota bacterium]MBT6146554.1 hypothetical protein [Gemmatimonadota bacterium]MBT7862652.1 hypothetical protein [Gemmatimonadota bacterium]
MARIDPEQLQERFDRLSSILGDIVTQADQQASERCPYRDRHDLCTAKFRCRNQAKLDRDQADAMRCEHDGRFDYRSAWESDPVAVEKARDRMKKTKKTIEKTRENSQHG